jgi:hypothetical protein
MGRAGYINYVKPFPHFEPKMAAVYITGDQSERVKALAAIKVFSSLLLRRHDASISFFSPFLDSFLTDFIFHVNLRFEKS